MAGTITSAMCTSFKDELLGGSHDLDTSGNTFKIALILPEASIPSATFDAASTNYSDITGDSAESSGTGYSAGGYTLLSQVVANSGTTAYVDFADAAWTISTTLSTGGAMIYNTSLSNAAVCIIDFGGTQTVTGGTLTIVFPTADASNAIIRIA